MFSVTKSVRDMDCIQVENPTSVERQILLYAVMNNWVDSEAYKAKTAASAFLKYDYKDFVLVEFWGFDYQPFVDYVNAQLNEQNRASR